MVFKKHYLVGDLKSIPKKKCKYDIYKVFFFVCFSFEQTTH